MREEMHFEMPFRETSVGTMVALEAFFAIVRLHVEFVSVTIWERFATAFASQWPIRSVQFLNVNLEICFSAASGWAQFTLEDWFIARMDQSMGLERVTLRKTLMTNIAFVWFFSGMNPQMAFQLKSVGTGVGAMGAGVGAFTCMGSYVSFEL